MSMNYFAFFPALANPATNPHAEVTGYFANPAGPNGKQHAALGGQGISIVSYSKNQEEAMKFLEWFIQDDVQKSWAELGGYTCHAAMLKSEEFRNATPYNEAFYQSMFMVKDFWAVPEYAELLTADQQPLYPFVVGGEGTARRRSTALAKDWDATFKKYGRMLTARAGLRPGGQRRPAPPDRNRRLQGREALRVLARLDPRSRAAAARLERPRDPQPVHHSDDRLPDRLQHLSADLLARLLVHRLPRVGERAGELRRPAELPRAARPTRTSGATSRSPPST